METEKPLEGLTVLDATTIYSGSMAAMLMGDFGAEVIKVEHPAAGDPLRAYGKYEEELNWKIYSRNKKSVTIDLHEEEGQALFKDLVEDSDVLIENFRPGTLEKWSVGWETLSDVNPGLVMIRITGFGQSGPYKDRPGFGTIVEAMSGFADVTGHEDGPPLLTQIAPADKVTALHATFSAMFALYWRDVNGGTGQFIDLSLLESMFGLMTEFATDYAEKGIVWKRRGNSARYGAPRGMYETSDGEWVALAASSQNVAMRALDAIGGEELADDPRFETNTLRKQHEDLLDEIIGDWTAERTQEEVVQTLTEHEVPVGPVYNMPDIFEDNHFEARDTLLDVPDDELGEITMANIVPKFSETPGSIEWTGPKLGEHSKEVLLERTSLTESQFEELVKKGVTSKMKD